MSPEPASRRTLCVVSPCFNEAAGIRDFVTAVSAVLDTLPELDARIVLVDDGSRDDTLGVLNALAATNPRLRVYALSRNFGHQVALSAGLDVAHADAVVLMDSDLQHPPALIPELVARWRAGADIVSAVRSRTDDASALKRWSASLFYATLNRISETHIVPDAADFVLLGRNAQDALRSMPERHRFLRGMVSWIGFRREFVSYRAPARRAGESSYTLRRMIRLASDALFSFSTAPVRLATRLGLALVALGVLYLAYILYVVFAHPERVVQGWTSLAILVLLLSGAQIMFVGLIGEYVARIFEESKQRPLYFFRQQPPPDDAPERAPRA